MPTSTDSGGRFTTRTAVWAAALVLLAVVAGGCGPKGNLAFQMQTFSAEKSFADTFKALDSEPKKLDCIIGNGADTIYEMTRYQWARLNALAIEAGAVRRQTRDRFLMNQNEELATTVNAGDCGTIDTRITVVPDSCCTFTLQGVSYTLHRKGGGETSVAFSCMYPVISNIFVELPPAAAGGRFTWILMDVEELATDHANPIP
jgi:hypothetical protein